MLQGSIVMDLRDEEEEGYQAANLKRSMDANPYTYGTPQNAAWHRGWENCHTDKADRASSEKYGF